MPQPPAHIFSHRYNTDSTISQPSASIFSHYYTGVSLSRGTDSSPTSHDDVPPAAKARAAPANRCGRGSAACDLSVEVPWASPASSYQSSEEDIGRLQAWAGKGSENGSDEDSVVGEDESLEEESEEEEGSEEDGPEENSEKGSSEEESSERSSEADSEEEEEAEPVKRIHKATVTVVCRYQATGRSYYDGNDMERMEIEELYEHKEPVASEDEDADDDDEEEYEWEGAYGLEGRRIQSYAVEFSEDEEQREEREREVADAWRRGFEKGMEKGSFKGYLQGYANHPCERRGCKGCGVPKNRYG